MAKTRNSKSNEDVKVKIAIVRFTKDKAYKIIFDEINETVEIEEV